MNEEIVLQPKQAPTPMDLLQLAMSQNADLAKLEQLMGLQERWEANQARKAFTEAMAAFKQESVILRKDKDNAQYKSKYTTLGNMVATVTPFLSKHGLSADWEIDQSNGIKVTCVITHIMGHSKPTSLIVPPDKSGAKNPIQEIKSAITYAKACTYESALGLASTDANLDDDGNGAGKLDVTEHVEWMQNARNTEELQKLFATAYKQAAAAKDKNAQSILIAAKDARKKELLCE